MLKKLLWTLFCFAMLAISASAQSTTVSGTITATGGQAYAGGTYRIEFFPNGVQGPYLWNGSAYVPTAFSGVLNGSGAFSGVSVPSNNYITGRSSGTTEWRFTVCPASTSSCFSQNLTVAGATQSVSSSITPPAIQVSAGPAISAYTDAEIIGAVLGTQYYNITDTTIHVCTVGLPCTWASQTTSSSGVSSVTGAGTVSCTPTTGNVVCTGTGGGGGTVTTTGSPASGNLSCFSGATSITNCNLSGDVTTSGTSATTLATVNANVGSFTNANITVNGKGLVTAASNGSGGSGVPCTTTALSIQYNNAGAFGCEPDFTFTTPHTLTLGASGIFTLASGATLNGLTTAMLPTGIPFANLAALSANQVLGALTATTPSGLSVPSCSGSANALIWTSGTGFGCNTISGGSATTITVGTTTVSSGTSPFLLYNNGGVLGNEAVSSLSIASTQIIGQIPISQVGSAGLSGTSPITISSAGAIACSTCLTSQVYPGAGIPISTGSAWGTSLSETDGNMIAGVSGAWTKVTALPNGITATTQTTGDSTTKVATDAFVIANAVSNPMTTLGDDTYGGASGVFTRLAGPTAPGTYVKTEKPASGAATAETYSLPGVVLNPQTGTTYTYLATDATTDRAGYTSFSNGSAVAAMLPQAGSTGFGSNWVNKSCNIGAGTVTITPTTSTISYTSGATYTSAASSMPLTTGQCAWIYSDNTNYFANINGGASGGGSGTVSNCSTQYALAQYLTTGTTVGCTAGIKSDSTGSDLLIAGYAEIGSALPVGTVANGNLVAVSASGTIANASAAGDFVGVYTSVTGYYATSGTQTLNLDGTQSVTDGDIVCQSTGSNKYQVHDNGSTACALGQFVGYVLTTASTVTTASVLVNITGWTSTGGSGSVSNCATAGGVAYYASTGTTVTCPAITVPTAAGSAVLSQTIASGTSALGTSAIASEACATVVTTTATGTASTDTISWTPNASIKAVTGYVPSSTGGLSIVPYPTTNNVNFDVCNWSSSSITPGAVTLNWRVAR